MIEKALSIMLFMWATSFSVFGMQLTLGSAYDIEIRNHRGEVIESQLAKLIDQDRFNETTEQIVSGVYTDENGTEYDRIIDNTVSSAYVMWELAQLLSGTYIFGFLYLLGVPPFFVALLVIIFLALLARAIVGYLRGT